MNIDLKPFYWVASMDMKELSYNIKTNKILKLNQI